MNKQDWKYFKMNDLFIFVKGNRLTADKMQSGDIPFISSTKFNNGVRQYIANGIIHKPNCITVNYNGSVGEAFYQDIEFIASDDVNILYSKNWELNKDIALFLCSVIKHNRSRFQFGRKWHLKRMKETMLLLPQKEGKPHWTYMEECVKLLRNKVKFYPINTNNKRKNVKLDLSDWKEFELSNLFEVSGSKTTPLYDLETMYGQGKYPYITTRATNNGVAGFYDHQTENGNVLVADSAVVGYVSYQSEDFTASDHVEILKPKFELNKYIALFIRTVIMKGSYKYAYGRKFNQDRIKTTKLLLPATVDDAPDWQFMEDYIKSLPYADNI